MLWVDVVSKIVHPVRGSNFVVRWNVQFSTLNKILRKILKKFDSFRLWSQNSPPRSVRGELKYSVKLFVSPILPLTFNPSFHPLSRYSEIFCKNSIFFNFGADFHPQEGLGVSWHIQQSCSSHWDLLIFCELWHQIFYPWRDIAENP